MIGGAGGLARRQVVQWRTRRANDDSLDAFGVHGVGGTVGALLAGVFASIGASGLILGNLRQVLVQAVGVAATIAYAVAVSLIILKVLDATVGLRVAERSRRPTGFPVEPSVRGRLRRLLQSLASKSTGAIVLCALLTLAAVDR